MTPIFGDSPTQYDSNAMKSIRINGQLAIEAALDIDRAHERSDLLEINSSPQRPRRLEEAASYYKGFLTALGVDADTEDLQGTPMRVAKSLSALLTPEPFRMTTFENSYGYCEQVVAVNIPFHSLCEHHVLPFFGRACVAYVPGGRVVGLSKLARCVQHFARRLQVQERMTTQIAQLLQEHLSPQGVAVILSAEHSCMTLRGVKGHGSSTITSCYLGCYAADRTRQRELVELFGRIVN